jgi:hypothetical protein
MSTASLSRSLGLLMAMTSLVIGAEPAPQCGKIAQDVTESITKEPSKTLMIVEDALVINESCACEIIKAAIKASKADAPMVEQIVATAVAVAPKMSPVIIECANATAPGTSDVTTVSETLSGKDAKSVQPVTPVEEPTSTPDYSSSTASIRGVYLMAPAVGGFITADPEDDVVEKPRTKKSKPISPSCTCPDDQ